MFGQNTEITRRELHALVWSSPMTEVAKRFAMSDRGLAKLCARYDIPVPDRGWWAKKAAGQAVQIAPLRPAANEYLEKVSVWVREDFRDWLKPEERADLEARVAREDDGGWVVAVDTEDEHTRHHPLLRTSKRPDALRFDMFVSSAARPRAQKIANAILRAFEHRGYTFVANEKIPTIAKVNVCGELIAVKLTEQNDSVDHVLTAKEERDVKAGRGWGIPKKDYIPNGKLTLCIDEYATNERRSFSDGVKQHIEDCLRDFMVALLRIAFEHRARTNYWDAWSRAREEAARKAEEERKRKEDEARRKKELIDDVEAFIRCRALREMVSALSSEPQMPEQVRRWVTFASAVANELDPIARIKGAPCGGPAVDEPTSQRI